MSCLFCRKAFSSGRRGVLTAFCSDECEFAAWWYAMLAEARSR